MSQESLGYPEEPSWKLLTTVFSNVYIMSRKSLKHHDASGFRDGTYHIRPKLHDQAVSTFGTQSVDVITQIIYVGTRMETSTMHHTGHAISNAKSVTISQTDMKNTLQQELSMQDKYTSPPMMNIAMMRGDVSQILLSENYVLANNQMNKNAPAFLKYVQREYIETVNLLMLWMMREGSLLEFLNTISAAYEKAKKPTYQGLVYLFARILRIHIVESFAKTLRHVQFEDDVVWGWKNAALKEEFLYHVGDVTAIEKIVQYEG